MLHIFQYNNANGQVELEKGQILLIREFAALMDDKRNVCTEDKTCKKHLRAYREFTYIYLAIDWESFYKDYTEQDRHQEALRDANLTEEEWNDPTFRAACRKYKEIQESNRTIRMLKAAQMAVDKFIIYFETVNPLDVDEQTGKPIYKVSDIMKEMSQISKVNDELKILEQQVQKEQQEASAIRAGAIDGFLPDTM